MTRKIEWLPVTCSNLLGKFTVIEGFSTGAVGAVMAVGAADCMATTQVPT